MRKKTFSYQKVFVLGVVAYLLVMLVVTAISVKVIYSDNRNLVLIAENDLAYYMETGTFSPQATQNRANNYIYAPDGTRTAFLASNGADLLFDFDQYEQNLRRYISGPDPVYRLKFSFDLPYHIAVAVAIPMEDGGLFLFLKELDDANSVLIFLYLSITLLGILSTSYLLFALRSSRSLEKLQREYVDNISHELKTPVAAVKALAEPIYDGMVDDKDALQRYCGIMLNEISNLENTISDMLELSRIQNRRPNAKKDVVAAKTVFGDVLEKYTVLCDDFGLSLFISPGLAECRPLRTNSAFASRLLDILLDNAVKFTEANGKIQVLLTKQQRHITITVKNDGPQIPPAAQKHIFERFYQGSKGHDKRGSGLGLAIAKEIADCLKESLWLEYSHPGDTAFSFTISMQ